MTLKEAISKITDLDVTLMNKAQEKLDSLTKPQGSLGRLEELAKQIVAISGNIKPEITNKYIVTVAGDHGVAKEGVSAFPQEVTPQMVHNFLTGGAAINVLARNIGAKVMVVDAGVASDIPAHPDLLIRKIGYGTANIAKGPAMSREDAIKALETGIELVAQLKSKGAHIIGTGDMGIANTTPSSAIVAAITGAAVESLTGRGTGIDDKGLDLKISVIKKALSLNAPDKNDGIDVLSKVGGFEIGVIAGIFIGGAANRIPVVIDGFISGAGALIASIIAPKAKQYMIPSHCSVEAGHAVTLTFMGLKPLFNMNMRLGEGTGAALGIQFVEASVKILNEMATFAQAGVSEKSEESKVN